MILDLREQKRRSLLRFKSIESQHPLIGPATVHLRLTDLCNLACQYCWYYGPGSSLHPPTEKNHLPFDLFKNIISDCNDLQVNTIHLSGVGDPTLHPRFYDMLPLLERSFEVHINSNGTFPIERCRDILRADRIVINLGEADRESYRALHGRDLFIKVIKNIRELARLKPQFNPNFRIEVIFIATRLNMDSLARTESLVKKLGADYVRKTIAESSAHTHDIILSDEEEKESSVSQEWPPCYQGWFYSSVKLNGDVNVCCFMQRITIGNVFKTSFKEVWGSKEYSQVRSSALTGDPFKEYKECINCRMSWRNKEIASSHMELLNRSRKA